MTTPNRRRETRLSIVVSRVRLLACTAVALLGLLAAQGAGAAETVPLAVKMPGSQPREAGPDRVGQQVRQLPRQLPSAGEPWFNWAASMMAHAARDPLFWATVAIAEQDFDGSGDLCIRCHTAEGWLDGRSTPTDGSGLAAGRRRRRAVRRLPSPRQSGRLRAPRGAELALPGARRGDPSHRLLRGGHVRDRRREEQARALLRRRSHPPVPAIGVPPLERDLRNLPRRLEPRGRRPRPQPRRPDSRWRRAPTAATPRARSTRRPPSTTSPTSTAWWSGPSASTRRACFPQTLVSDYSSLPHGAPDRGDPEGLRSGAAGGDGRQLRGRHAAALHLPELPHASGGGAGLQQEPARAQRPPPPRPDGRELLGSGCHAASRRQRPAAAGRWPQRRSDQRPRPGEGARAAEPAGGRRRSRSRTTC